MINRKRSPEVRPLDSRLPGRFGKMTARELDAEVALYDTEVVQGKPISVAEWNALRAEAGRRRGRPAKAAGEKYARIILTLPPALLTATDAAAKKAGTTRAAVIADALRTKLKLSA